MPRLNKLEEVLFPVDEYPVFVSFEKSMLSIPNKKAIVNRENHRVLGVVSRNYRLVTNQDALQMADRCCQTVFPETKTGEWTVTAIDAPGTAGHCYFDLVHNSTALDFGGVSAGERPDAFGPFIRVTNSYNALRALSFDIGFYRKICKNGLILPETVITFRFAHVRSEIGENIEFHIDQKKLSILKTSLRQFHETLRSCEVPRAAFASFVCGVLCLKKPSEPNERDVIVWDELSAHIDEINRRYANELGENAYAVFNVITEFASSPPANRLIHRDRHSMQRMTGSWLNAFTRECGEPNFHLEKYLEKLAPSATVTQ